MSFCLPTLRLRSTSVGCSFRFRVGPLVLLSSDCCSTIPQDCSQTIPCWTISGSMFGLASDDDLLKLKIKDEPQDSIDHVPFITNAVINARQYDPTDSDDLDTKGIYEVKMEPSDSSDSESEEVDDFDSDVKPKVKQESIDPLTGHQLGDVPEEGAFTGNHFGKLCDILGVKIEPSVKIKIENEALNDFPVDAFSEATHIPNPAAKKQDLTLGQLPYKIKDEGNSGWTTSTAYKIAGNGIAAKDGAPKCFVSLERLPFDFIDKPSVTIRELLEIAESKSRKRPKGGTKARSRPAKRRTAAKSKAKTCKSGIPPKPSAANRVRVTTKESFACNECKFTTISRTHMRQHIKDHINRNSDCKFRKCPFCNFETHDHLTMIQHSCASVEAKLITCQYCDIQLPPDEIQLHLTEMHARLIELSLNNEVGNVLACYYCSYTTSDKKSLRSHVSVHIGEKKMTSIEYIDGRKYFKCQFCDYKTWRHGCFQRHMNETRKHGGSKTYRCKKCGSLFLRKQHLTSHQQDVHNLRTADASFPCDKCGKTYSIKSRMMAHMRTHEERMFPCDMCKFKGMSAVALRNHKMVVHLNFRPYPCPECDHRAKTKNGLETHMLTHSTEKPFACPHCEYRTNRMFVLKSHLKCVHSAEKPFACPECEYKTKSKGALVSHMKRHTNIRPFKCPVEGCDHRTIVAAAMKSHMAKHTGIRPFGCPFCKYRASRSFLIKVHVRTHHRSLESEYVGPTKGL